MKILFAFCVGAQHLQTLQKNTLQAEKEKRLPEHKRILTIYAVIFEPITAICRRISFSDKPFSLISEVICGASAPEFPPE
jgi:hypothetical protein